MLEPVTVVGRDAHIGVEAESLDRRAPAAGNGRLQGASGTETPAAELGEKIRETEQRVRNLLDALAKMGWSESLAVRVKEEEGRAVDLGRARQKTVPHPKTIEGYLRNLVAILDGDRTRAREILAKHLGHLVLTPGENGYQITGAFGLHLTPTRVRWAAF